MSSIKYSIVVLLFALILPKATSVKDVKKAVGDTVSFRLEPTPSPPLSSIIWKQKNTAGVVVKAIEWDIDDGISIPNPKFKDITTLDKQTGEITITRLRLEHAGLYTIDVNSKEQEQKFTLSFMDPVPKPKMVIERIPDNSKTVYLKCSFTGEIIFKKSDKEILEGAQVDGGESITVKKNGNPDEFYTCTLKNEVSEETSEPVYMRDLFKDEPSQPWWIILLFLIPCLIFGIFVAVFKLCKDIRERLLKWSEGKSCIEGFLQCLEGKQKEGRDTYVLNAKPNDAGATDPLNGTQEAKK